MRHEVSITIAKSVGFLMRGHPRWEEVIKKLSEHGIHAERNEVLDGVVIHTESVDNITEVLGFKVIANGYNWIGYVTD